MSNYTSSSNGYRTFLSVLGAFLLVVYSVQFLRPFLLKAEDRKRLAPLADSLIIIDTGEK